MSLPQNWQPQWDERTTRQQIERYTDREHLLRPEQKEQIQQQIMQMMQAQAQQESAAMAEPPVADENMPADETGMIMEQEAMNNE